MKHKHFVKYFKNQKDLFSISIIFFIAVSIFSSFNFGFEILKHQYFYDQIESFPVDFVSTTNQVSTTYKQFHDFVEENSRLQIDEFYLVNSISIDNAEINLNFTDSNHKKFHFSFNSKLKLIGIEESCLNLISRQEYNKISNFETNWSKLNDGFFLGGLLEPYLDGSSLIGMNFSSINESIELNSLNQTLVNIFDIQKNISSQTNITETYEIFDQKNFLQFFTHEIIEQNFPIFIGSRTLLLAIKTTMEDNLIQFKYDQHQICLFKKNEMQKLSIRDLNKEFNNLKNNLLNKFGYQFIFEEWILTWDGLLQSFAQGSFNTQLMIILFLFPIFIFAYKNLIDTMNFIAKRHLKRTKSLIINGLDRKTLIREYLIFIGIFNILIAIVGTLVAFPLSIQMINLISKGIKSSTIILVSMLKINLLLNLGINVLILSTSTIIIFADVIYNNWFDVMEDKSYTTITHNHIKRRKQKGKKFLLLIGLVSLGLSYYFTYKFGYYNITLLSSEMNFKLYILLYLSVPILGLFPYIFSIVGINFIFYRLLNGFKIIKQKIASKTKILNKKKRRYFSNLLFWKLSSKSEQNQIKILRYILSIILINIFMNLHSSYLYSESLYSSMITGNGQRTSFFFNSNTTREYLESKTSIIESNLTVLEISDHNTLYYSEFNNQYKFEETHSYFWDISILYKNHKNIGQYRFSTTDYPKLFERNTMDDSWFVNSTKKDIISFMQRSDAILIPSFLLTHNFTIGEKMFFQYRTKSGEFYQNSGIIIGSYHHFPTVLPENPDDSKEFFNETSATIFMHPDLLLNLQISNIDSIFYSEKALESHDFYEIQKIYNKAIKIPFSSSRIFDNVYFMNLENIAFDFIPILNGLLAIFAISGFIVNMFLSKNQINHELGILRAQGHQKNTFIKINFLECLILSFIGFICYLLVFIGSPVMIRFVNFFRSPNLDKNFYIIYHPNNSQMFGSAIIGFIIFIGLEFIYLFQEIKRTDVDEKLEKLMRYF